MKSTLPLILAYAVNTGSKVIILIAITRIGGLEAAGEYSLALSVVTPTFLLFGLSLRQLYVTAPEGASYASYLRLRAAFGASGVLVVAVIGLIGFGGSAGVVVAMAAYRFSELLVDMNVAYFQRRDRIGSMAVSLLGFSVITAGSLLLAYSLTEDLIAGLSAAAAVGALVFVVTAAAGRVGKTESDLRGVARPDWYLARDGITLASASFLTSLGANLPVIVLSFHGTMATVGAFAAIYNLSAISNVLYTSVSDAELRRFSGYVRSGDMRSFVRLGWRVSLLLGGIAMLAAICLFFVGPPVFSLVFGQDFTNYLSAMMIVAASICVAPHGYMTDVQLTSLQRFRSQSLLAAAALGFAALLSFVLIPSYGIVGCALVVFLVMLGRNVAKALIVRRAVHLVPAR